MIEIILIAGSLIAGVVAGFVIANSKLNKGSIKEKENLEAAEVAGNGEAVFVYTSDLIARITAQTCRQSGLSLIYSNLIQFEGDEIYFHEQKELFGKTYKEILQEPLMLKPDVKRIIHVGRLVKWKP